MQTVKLKEFLDTYGGILGQNIETNLTPVYNPLRPVGVAEFQQRIEALRKVPYRVQGEIVKAVSKAVYRDSREHLFVVGEMGSGKTLVGLGVTQCAPAYQRTLVVCPTHLVEKWMRETKDTIPGVKVVDLTVKNVISVLEALRRDQRTLRQHQVHVISKEKAKLGYAWRAAAHFNKRSVMPHCPQCFQIVMENDEYITWEQLQKKKHVCGSCGSPLWQADKKVRRFPPADYIKKYLKGYYQSIVLDEIQDYKAEGSLQGRAMGSLIAASERCICLTGTLNGGYADDLFVRREVA